MMASNSEPLPEGTVIMADKQYAGRGQQENIWTSEPGKNLTISIYLEPKFLSVDKQFFLNMAVSNALSSSLKKLLGDRIKIKWPNDIYYENSKIGGVLIENIVSGDRLKASVVGIGLNVNQKHFGEALEMKASSIHRILQRDVDLIKLLGEICSHIEKEYLLLRTEKNLELKNVYINNLYRFDQLARYRQNGEVFLGRLIDVSDAGQLILNVNNENFRYNFKEIEFLMNNN
jgi:BirA family biotin operon repressor/biotin-[acetyl-CoA-carboxylase] ligase